jgi:hypothetical protein
MKVTEEREIPFAQMRDTLRATISNNKAFQKASQLADLAYEKATEFNDLRKAAEVLAKELKVSPGIAAQVDPIFQGWRSVADAWQGRRLCQQPSF